MNSDMKINRLETHDRFEHFTKQSFDIGKTCQDMIDSRPFGDHSFYIFAHKREIDMAERLALFNEDLWASIADPNYKRMFNSFEEVPSARIVWQPRLTKPEPQENSMLFKGYPGSDNIKLIWMIPASELWEQFEKGKMTENETIYESIQLFKNNPGKLAEKESDDYSDEAINLIYEEIARAAKDKPKEGKIIQI